MSPDMSDKFRALTNIGNRHPEFVAWAGTLSNAIKWERLIAYHADMAYQDAETGYDTAPLKDEMELLAEEPHVPLIAYICHGLQQDKSGDLPEDLFLKLLRFTLSEEEAERALRVAIEWGRYGDLFEYNFNTGVIQRPEQNEQAG